MHGIPSHLLPVFANIQHWITSLSFTRPSDERLVDLLNLAYKSADQVFGENAALKWADGFSIPNTVVANHTQLFESCSFDMKRLVSTLKSSIAGSRISLKSIDRVVSPTNDDYSRVRLLVDGMPLLPADTFQPSSYQESISRQTNLSSTYQRLAPAVDRMLYEDFVKDGLAFVLPLSLVKRHTPRFHLSRLSWTSKVGKEKGRPILDCSAGVYPLNSEETKQACDSLWGVIRHPSIQTFIQMILDFVDSQGVSLNDVILWKVDLKGAYTLLSFKDEDVPLVGALMSEENVIFFLCGVFGWTGTPASFQVLTRVIKQEVNLLIQGEMDMYVDDMMGVSLLGDVDDDINKATTFCRSLFDSDCIADSKTEKGRSIDVIGYTINLDNCHVSLTVKNQHRVIYGLSTIERGMSISVKLMERFASWLSRYAEVIPNLKPLIRPIYLSFQGLQKFTSFELRDETVRVLQIFRAIFLSAMLDEVSFTRNLYSFRPSKAQMVIEFDASLSGGGILFFDGIDGTYLGASIVNLGTLGFGVESKYQNYAEFIVAIIGLIGALSLKPNLRYAAFRGDSISALKWLSTGRVKSGLAHNLSTIFINLCVKYNLEVTEVSHVPGVLNTSADLLSRNGSIADVRKIDERVKSNRRLIIPCSIFLSLCKANNIPSTDEEFIVFWNAIPIIINHMIKSTSVISC